MTNNEKKSSDLQIAANLAAIFVVLIGASLNISGASTEAGNMLMGIGIGVQLGRMIERAIIKRFGR